MNSLIKKAIWHISEKLGVAELRRTNGDAHALEIEKYLEDHLQHSERAKDPKWLGRFERQLYSQGGEDGVIEEIFKRIGTTNKTFVEFGVSQGLENNTLALLLAGWKGFWLEGSEKFYTSIQKNFADPIAEKKLTVKNAFVTAEKIEELFKELGVPNEPDFLSIDIDGQDYWVWKAIQHYKPRALVVEYCAHIGPSLPLVIPNNPEWVWDRSMIFNSGLKAYELLGAEKGYVLVYCNIVGQNAFFVRKDLVGDKFSGPFTAEYHYQKLKLFLLHPIRYGRKYLPLTKVG